MCPLRLLYLIFSRLVLFGRASSSKDIELLVLGPEISVLRKSNPRPRLDPGPTEPCSPP
jgi:putative transposase